MSIPISKKSQYAMGSSAERISQKLKIHADNAQWIVTAKSRIQSTRTTRCGSSQQTDSDSGDAPCFLRILLSSSLGFVLASRSRIGTKHSFYQTARLPTLLGDLDPRSAKQRRRTRRSHTWISCVIHENVATYNTCH